MTQGRVQHWQQVYATKAPDSVSWYQAVPAPSLAALERVGAGPATTLIDVGGGVSLLVDALLERGWRDVTVLDVSEGALAAARTRLGGQAARVTWIAADAAHWRPARTWQVWHDRAAFHFLTEAADRRGYLAALREGLEPGGHLVLATFAPDGPERCSGLPVRRYDAAGMLAKLGEGFAAVADWREEHRTPGGATQRFQWACFRRAG